MIKHGTSRPGCQASHGLAHSRSLHKLKQTPLPTVIRKIRYLIEVQLLYIIYSFVCCLCFWDSNADVTLLALFSDSVVEISDALLCGAYEGSKTPQRSFSRILDKLHTCNKKTTL